MFCTKCGSSCGISCPGSEEEEGSDLEEGDMPAERDGQNAAGEQDVGTGATAANEPERESQVRESAKEEEGEKAAGATVGVDAHDDATLCEKLFNGLVFFLGREVPMEPLLFVIR